MATIRKRGDSYSIRVSCGYDTNGKHKEQAMTWKPEPGMTKRQIEKELQRQAVLFEEAVAHGYKTTAVKFQEFAEEWFEEYAKLNLRSTTYERMRQLTHRVYPAIGHLRMDKITARQLQGFVNSLAKEGANEKTGKPLAPKTIRHNLSFISDVFSYAVKMDLLSDNPCRKVTIPKGEVKEKQIYSQEEMALLLTRISGEPTKYRAFFFLIAYSGFRRSEMLGLEWKDIDFENNIITVKRTSNYTAERGIYTDTTKTKRSQRVLKISPYIMGILKELKDEQDEEALRLGDKWVDSDRLFVKWNGEPMNNQTPYGWLKEFCEKNELPFYGIHSFRHFAASALISAGLDVTTVSGALGHCNSGTTLNVYSHMFQNAQARVAEAMDGAFSFLPQDTTT
ncbi:tyrosine-type recombinase/integrase [uncultured Ruminococcus sp.]|uniref:tyrosine-type recombinase/integrase n=1 Tax=uncultured Ruminococcus sp. TaxID=165186 RepID=UPI0025E48AB9|nr:tyrosine-type recombinase/integrase [uncultured Ruminococcus sp.]